MATVKPAGLGLTHKILIIFVFISIIGDISNVLFWQVSPDSRALSPNTGYIVHLGALTAHMSRASQFCLSFPSFTLVACMT